MNETEFKSKVTDKIYNHINKLKTVNGCIDRYPKYIYLGREDYDYAEKYKMIREEKYDYILGCKVILVFQESFMEVG